MTASDIRKLKDLEDENRRLKRMYADLCLQDEALKDVVEKSFEASRKTQAGHPWIYKRVCRVNCALNLSLRRKGKKRLPNQNLEPQVVIW
jgi:hypothetical protein